MKLKERAKKLKTDIPALIEITVRLIPKDVMEKIRSGRCPHRPQICVEL